MLNFEHFTLSVLKLKLVFQARTNKMLIRKKGTTLIRLLFQKQSGLGLPCLSRLLWQATTVQNFRTFTIYHEHYPNLSNSAILCGYQGTTSYTKLEIVYIGCKLQPWKSLAMFMHG